MNSETVPVGREPRPSRPSRNILIIALIAFVAGSIAMGWALTRWGGAGSFFAREAAPVQKSGALATPDRTLGGGDAVLPRPVSPPDPAQADQLALRVMELEQRIARISVSADAASGNATRAEGLLIAFAARRALDRGVALGYIENQLRERFGATQPRAVATVIATSRQPVTLEELRIALDDLGPELAASGSSQDWWGGFKREMSGLFVVRKAGTPSPAPAERLRRAKRRLESGQVDAALAEVARMPGSGKAANWMAAARRHIEARRALDIIETAAILDPQSPPPAPAEGAGERAGPGA